jgi:hypothetical protein
MNGILSLLKSRKFWLAMVGMAIPIANRVFSLELSQEEVLTAVGPLVALIFSIAWEDAAKPTKPE